MARAAAEIPFNPAIFKWARERRLLGWSDVARRVHVDPEKIQQWESGESSPTVRQARMLAHVYERPFLELFSLTIPELPATQLAPDFRMYQGGPNSVEQMALEEIQQWAETQRLNAIDLYQELGEEPPPVPQALRASINDDPESAAKKVRDFLEFPIEEQTRLNSSNRYTFPQIIRRYIERAAILVLKQSDLSKARTRGICLYSDVLPVIVFGNEAPGAQAFTLVHELAHVLLGQSAISGQPILAYKKGASRRRIEGWCNAFAAAFLMPYDVLKGHPFAPREKVDEIDDVRLNALANAFAVSRHAMLVRLVSLGLVAPNYYWRIKRPVFVREEGDYTGGGRSEYYGSRYRSALGDHYTGLVLEALNTGRIGIHSASEFMGIKNPRHLEDIRAKFGR